MVSEQEALEWAGQWVFIVLKLQGQLLWADRKEREEQNPILVILTNQLAWAHRNWVKNTSAKFQLCQRGGYESGRERRVVAWAIGQ